MYRFFFKKQLRILIFTNAIILLAAAMLGPIYAIYVEKIGGDLMDASIAGSIFSFVAGITALISGKYSDKIKENELIIVLGYTVMGIGFLLYLWVSSVFSLFIVQAIIGFGEAIYFPAFDTIYSKYINHNKSGIQWGAWESMYYFVTAIGAIIGGSLVTLFGFKIMFLIMSFLCFTSALYLYFLKRDVL